VSKAKRDAQAWKENYYKAANERDNSKREAERLRTELEDTYTQLAGETTKLTNALARSEAEVEQLKQNHQDNVVPMIHDFELRVDQLNDEVERLQRENEEKARVLRSIRVYVDHVPAALERVDAALAEKMPVLPMRPGDLAEQEEGAPRDP
jgi:Skp family chaperone for outer membrane proteins